MNRRTVLLAVVVASVVVASVVVVVAGVALWFGLRHAASSPSEDPGAGEAPAVVSALAHLESDPTSLVPAQLADELGGNIESAVPRGSTVVADASTWAPDGSGGGTIVVTLTPPGGEPVTFLAIMNQESDGWKVLATIAMDEGGATP